MHQADLFLPHDKLPHGRKVYKYALIVVDVANRFKAAEPLTSEESDEVLKAFQRIYRRGPLKWPQVLKVDPGREFMGAVTEVMENNETAICRGRTEIHRECRMSLFLDYSHVNRGCLPCSSTASFWKCRLSFPSE